MWKRWDWLTIEDVEVELVDVQAGLEVLLDHVARRVDVGPGVHHHPELRHVVDGPVGHGLREPGHRAQPVPPGRRQLRPVRVRDVDDPPAAVLLQPHLRAARARAAAGADVVRVCRVGGTAASENARRQCRGDR